MMKSATPSSSVTQSGSIQNMPLPSFGKASLDTMKSASGNKTIFVSYHNAVHEVHIDGEEGATASSVRNALKSIAGITHQAEAIIKLTRVKTGSLLPIGLCTPVNTAKTPYLLSVKLADKSVASTNAEEEEMSTSVMEDIALLQNKTTSLLHQAEMALRRAQPKDHIPSPAQKRIQCIPKEILSAEIVPKKTFSPEVLEALTKPDFDVWQYSDEDLIQLIEAMLDQFDIFAQFNLPRNRFRTFMKHVQCCYNENAFHNFKHCFCVTQMMYAILHVTGVHEKLSPLEKLSLLIACIGHDLDHPGKNNAYQINAASELAIWYNDSSPLENHHCAMLFTLLLSGGVSGGEGMNFLGPLSPSDFRELRRIVILCVLATDMAKHGDILAKFKAIGGGIKMEDVTHKQLLFQMLIKCSDISNEIRPKSVSEPWVDRLLQEFFQQSDAEKAAGLPFAPFMDRDKVTKSSAQVGFINFVMIPLYEALGKGLPNVDEYIIKPIKASLEYYKSL